MKVRMPLPLLLGFLLAGHIGGVSAAELPHDGPSERDYSVQVLSRIAEPVLTSLSDGKLKERLPNGKADRQIFAPLEAFGRLLAGIAPWLELGPGEDAEGKLRARYIALAVEGLRKGFDPKSPDFMNLEKGRQPLVDGAFLALGLLRAPHQLWGNLTPAERENLVAGLKRLRTIKPGMNNWLLFSATIEAALWQFTGACDIKPVEFAVNNHMKWYLGDGTYGDGPKLHWDYYNSYVIQPMLLEVLRVCREKNHPLGDQLSLVLERAQRYATVQERLISPEGTFPILGRSSCYRFGAFQTLSLMALMHQLPPETRPGAVRAGLTTVIQRMIEAPGTFDESGWLHPGAAGFQKSLQEYYISPGSLYLCTVGMLHLGLPASDPFWTVPDEPWTQKRIWAGEDIPADHAMDR